MLDIVNSFSSCQVPCSEFSYLSNVTRVAIGIGVKEMTVETIPTLKPLTRAASTRNFLGCLALFLGPFLS